jgi:hypothetical protein
MRKVFIMPLLCVLAFACALQAGKNGSPEAAATPAVKAAAYTDRIDFTAAAGDFTQVSGAAPVQAQAQSEDQQENAKGSVLGTMLGVGGKNKSAKAGAAAARQKAEPTVPEAMGFTFDLMSIPRSTIDPFDLDLSFSLVFGDYGNFGLDAIYYIQFVSTDPYFGGTVGLDLAFDIFPLGNSPCGLYFGPVLGGRMYIFDSDISGGIVPGANAGYRFDLGGFIIDAGVIYDAIFTFNDKVTSPISDFQFQLSIGGFFEQVTPEMIKAKQQGDKPQGDKK